MMRTIIIDDEQNCIDTLSFDLHKYCSGIELVTTCTSSSQGLIAIQQFQPDLVFLDVQMPWMNGLEMLELLGKINFSIVFTTAFDQFAAKAFRLSAVDYLLKPVDINDLKEAIIKAKEKVLQKSGTANINNLLHNINKPEASQRIAFAGRDGYEFVEVSSIIYAQAEGAYTHVYFRGNKKMVISKTLSDIEEVLPSSSFIRIHHSTLINMHHVTHFLRSDGGYIVLDDNIKLGISKSKKEQVMLSLGLK